MLAQSAVYPNKQGRSLCRSVDEEYLDRVRAYQPTEAYKKALRKRSVWVEPLFAGGQGVARYAPAPPAELKRVNCEALLLSGGAKSQAVAQDVGLGTWSCPRVGLT